MRYYPLFLDLKNKKVVFSGAGDHAAAKIRLLLKTEAEIVVIGEDPCDDVLQWAELGKITFYNRPLQNEDVRDARLVYGANDDLPADEIAIALGRSAGALTNIVDNLEASEFLTPAMVDRDPVTIAIGTEGTAPVLARKIKADIEALLPASTGLFARIGDAFRPIAGTLKTARLRREFWTKFFFTEAPKALLEGGRRAVGERLETLYHEVSASDAARGHVNSAVRKGGSVTLIGTGPGDPELLTLKARRMLHEAEVVLYDQLVTSQILELARREAVLIHVGKKGFGKSWKQDDINALLIEHAKAGAQIVRLKSGDPSVFGRMDEELDALEEAGIDWDVVPGITAASAAAASIGSSLTRRGRNSALQFLTGHDVDGFAEQDWNDLAATGATAAIYMGLKAATFIRGRLLMHGAKADTPVTIVPNVSRMDQKVITTTLLELPDAIKAADMQAPAILLLGLKSRRAAQALNQITLPQMKTGAA